MTRKFLDSLDTEGGDAVEPGTYVVEVADARALEDKPFIWLDLKIIGGPDDGRVVSVGMNVPDDHSSRGAIFFFKKKVRGFIPQINAAKILDQSDDEQPDAIAEAIIGVRVEADFSTQSGGDYDGSQQLDETRQMVDVERADAPPPPTPIRQSAAAKAEAARAALAEAEAEAAAAEAEEAGEEAAPRKRAAAAGESVPVDDNPPF
jgi:hypothetical protein